MPAARGPQRPYPELPQASQAGSAQWLGTARKQVAVQGTSGPGRGQRSSGKRQTAIERIKRHLVELLKHIQPQNIESYTQLG